MSADAGTLEAIIDEAWAARERPGAFTDRHGEAVQAALELLDAGTARVAEKVDGNWRVHEWLKKAVLLHFRMAPNRVVEAGALRFYDKVPLKYTDASEAELASGRVRIVPHAVVRKGAYVAPDVVLMPCYVNIGARIGSGSMIDTWATVGSCAQIGSNVHLSGGAGIGGVLEPLQARPTIIEDDCFIGARSEIVEGVIVETGAVISMGVFIGQSTRIYDRERDEIIYGRVPAGAVVVPGSLPAKDGSHSLACAVIVKRVDERTRDKVGLNELLRGFAP
jgi:2,3,4,5-tetrahydropyridine-2-carboxylate N-succinyltransferase